MQIPLELEFFTHDLKQAFPSQISWVKLFFLAHFQQFITGFGTKGFVLTLKKCVFGHLREFMRCGTQFHVGVFLYKNHTGLGRYLQWDELIRTDIWAYH